MLYLIIIVFPICFLGVRALIRLIFKERLKHVNIWSGLTAGILLYFLMPVLVILMLELCMYEYHPDRKFSKDSWSEDLNDRFEMAEDIIDHDLFLNQSKSYIINKIGYPIGIEKEDMHPDTSSLWRYDMGSQQHGFGLKFHYLHIVFNDSLSTSISVQEVID